MAADLESEIRRQEHVSRGFQAFSTKHSSSNNGIVLGSVGWFRDGSEWNTDPVSRGLDKIELFAHVSQCHVVF